VQTSVDRIYLDSSAVVKLVIRERETDALVRFLSRQQRQVSCALLRTEVLRAVRPHGQERVNDARAVLTGILQTHLSVSLLDLAAEIGPPTLRSLDAIHLAAASRLAPNIEVVTYDHRLGEAAHAIGLPVVSPGA
jgi:predicted nucleic acid-binding protein